MDSRITSSAPSSFDDEAFESWRAKHPGGLYSQFSAEKVAGALRKGRSHPTHGTRLDFAGDWWDAGRRVFEELLDFYPVAEQAVVCDYGCGSLRVGAHFIKRQPPSAFIGLDVTDDFIDMGRTLIGPNLINEKNPQLGSISALIEAAEAANVNYLYSTHAAIHVHPQEKRVYIENLKRIAHRPGSIVVFDALITRKQVRFRNSGWGWPVRFYLEAMAPLRLVDFRCRCERAGVGQEYCLAFQRD